MGDEHMCALENVITAAEAFSRIRDEEIYDDLDPTAMYFKEVANHPRLSAEKELELIIQFQDNLRYIRRSDKGKIESDEEARTKAKIAYKQAAKTLCICNQGFIISIAKHYRGQGLSYLSLIQEGNTGFLRSLEKFDRNSGNRFSTYAGWWIMAAITRALANKSRCIRLPVYIHESINKMRNLVELYTKNNGEKPTTEYIAEKMNWSITKVEEIIPLLYDNIVSLDMPIGEDQYSTRGEVIEDTMSEPPIDYTLKEELEHDIREALKELPEQMRRTLEMRFGFDGDEKTLEEIGDIYNLSRERIRQIEAEAMGEIIRSKYNLGLRWLLM